MPGDSVHDDCQDDASISDDDDDDDNDHRPLPWRDTPATTGHGLFAATSRCHVNSIKGGAATSNYDDQDTNDISHEPALENNIELSLED